MVSELHLNKAVVYKRKCIVLRGKNLPVIRKFLSIPEMERQWDKVTSKVLSHLTFSHSTPSMCVVSNTE